MPLHPMNGYYASLTLLRGCVRCVRYHPMNGYYTSLTLWTGCVRHVRYINTLINHLPTCHMSSATCDRTNMKEQDLKLRRVVLLCKVTRYDYEKHLHRDLSEHELDTYLSKKGSDVVALRERCQEYHRQIAEIQETFQKHKIEVQTVQKFDYAEKLVSWADAVFTAGGDGTFLMAASKVKGHSIPVIGINTDPIRSEGYLCLPKKYSADLESALQKIITGNFRWLWRQRISLTMSGKFDINEVVDLQQQQILYPENRFAEHVQENEDYHRGNQQLEEQEPRQLPILALNDVFIGESLSARVSFYELGLDGGVRQKQKSSGITVCTGTGSTSWYFNINHLTDQSVREILTIAQKHSHNATSVIPSDEEISQITSDFNKTLLFDPSHLQMAHTIRDPILNGVFSVEQPRGFCTEMSVLSRMWDGWVVVDGSLSVRFNDGAVVKLSMHENDALRCVALD